MRGITARLARGASPPLHPQTKEGLRAPLWNPPEQEPSRPCTLDGTVTIPATAGLAIVPAKGAFALPWNPSTAVSAAASPKGLSCSLETRSGRSDP